MNNKQELQELKEAYQTQLVSNIETVINTLSRIALSRNSYSHINGAVRQLKRTIK